MTRFLPQCTFASTWPLSAQDCGLCAYGDGANMARKWFGADGQRLLCAVCMDQDAKVSGRCAPCMNYMRRHGHDRPAGEKPRRRHVKRPMMAVTEPMPEATASEGEVQERLATLQRELMAEDPRRPRRADHPQTLTLEEYRRLSDGDRRALLYAEYGSIPRKEESPDLED